MCTQNQCLLSADFVFQELCRTHIPHLVVYKCALAIASGKIKLIHSERISSELKKVCTYVPYEALTSVYLVRTYIPFSLEMKNFHSLSGREKITARIVKGSPWQLRRIFISVVNLKIDVFAVFDVFIGFVAYILAVLAVYSDVFGRVDSTEKNTANTSNTPIFDLSCKVRVDFDV